MKTINILVLAKFIVSSIALLLYSYIVFRVMWKKDYSKKQRLSPLSTVLATLVFVLHGSLLYLVLPTKWPYFPQISQNQTIRILFTILLGIGIIILLISWFRLGTKISLGADKNKLQTNGLYKFSRNPQMLGYGFVLASFVIAYISYWSLIWFLLYLIVAYFMIKSEEEFLIQKYNEEYKDYCRQVPRIIFNIKKTVSIILISVAALYQIEVSAQQVNSPESVLAGFEMRVDRMFRAEAGKPLARAEKRKPISPGRGNYVRHYSWSMLEFAARCLYLDEMLDEANAALMENAQHYLDNPKDINDRDSFHWHADMVLRLIELYGTNGSRKAGRITKETEILVLKPIWEYVRKSSKLSHAEHKASQTWNIYSSENHHAMDFTICWHFAKLARFRPEYRDMEFDNGGTAAEHYRAWNDYFVVYCRERARKGLCVEMMSDDYNSVFIKNFYNFYDFGEPRVRKSAGLLLDLYYAYWAQEQIDGVQGGGRSRIYFLQGLMDDFEPSMAPFAWYYFAIGEPVSLYCPSLNAALSDYRPPAVVADIALDVDGRGRYEVRQRPLGLGQSGKSSPIAYNNIPSKMRTDTGGILRYCYCDPAFIMGTAMTEARPLKDWAAISSQNRWQGVIFRCPKGARIVPIVRPEDGWVVLNAHWSVQNKGSLITQKLKEHQGGKEMTVWLSEDGLTNMEEADGIVFTEAEEAYAAIRVVRGGYGWENGAITYHGKDSRTTISPPGKMMVLHEEFSPVIVEVMAKSDVKNYEEFKSKVRACEMNWDGPVLHYKTIYGDRLTLDTSYKQIPTINNNAVNYAPSKAFESPFLNGDWNSGIVSIKKGNREKVLDFNSLDHE